MRACIFKEKGPALTKTTLKNSIWRILVRRLGDFFLVFAGAELPGRSRMRARSKRRRRAIRRVLALNFGWEILGWRDGALYPLACGSRWRGESAARCRCDWRGEIGGRLGRQRR